jgi:hypothetical protein
MINFRIDLWLRTYFHDIMEPHVSGPGGAPAKRAARQPAEKKAVRGKPAARKRATKKPATKKSAAGKAAR